MDIKKSKKPKNNAKRLLLINAVVIISALVSYYHFSHKRITLDKKDLLITGVKQGDLSITIDGYGKLVSEKLQLITSLTQATVKEIILKPGASVTKDSIIVKLENPKLVLAYQNAQQELMQLTANLRQMKVNQQREMLNEQAMLTELQSNYESAKLKRVAEEKLVADGIISQISFKQSQLNESQLSARIEILNKRLQQLSLVHIEALNIRQQVIAQQQGVIANIKHQIEQLDVKAGIEGVLQRLAVTLGQSLSPGQEIALLGSTKELIAEVKVPQLYAPSIKIGQQVEINTHPAIITGTVTRIDPVVADNTVSIDVALANNIPENARPEQNINAKIITKTLHNVTYIDRPANIKTASRQAIYRLNQQGDLASRTVLEFGEQAGRYIQVLSPVTLNEQFIISDLSNYQVNEISIN